MGEQHELHRVRNVHDLIGAAIGSYNRFKRRPWFRGCADSSWHLQPSLFRQRVDGWQPRDVLTYERTLVNDFIRFAPSRASTLPPLSDLAAWLCMMRHYGLPTRMLDWTTSVLVAGYFAVSECPSACADVWALDMCGLNEDAVGSPEHLSMRSNHDVVQALLKRPFKDVPVPEKTVAVIAPEVDLRLMLQQGVFTLHGTGTPLDLHPAADKRLIRFHIDKGDKGEILGQLSLLGFERMNLFPDLDNMCRSLAEWKYGAIAS